MLLMGVPRIRPVVLGAPPPDPTPPNAGARAAAEWLADREVGRPTMRRWHVEISLSPLDAPASLQFDERVDTRFHVDIYAEEWGFFFCHGGHTSWIRVTDIPFIHGRDDFQLLAQAPPLADIGSLLRGLENEHRLLFRRKHALVRTNLAGVEPGIRRWIETL